MSEVQVRKAVLHDVPGILDLVEGAARRGEILPRTAEEVYEGLRSWTVAVEEGGAVVGCAALVILWWDLAEIRSLVVDPAYQGRGIGRRLVEACLQEARELGIGRVFALTRAVPFFQRLGFRIVAKESFPQKIWKDCLRCPIYFRCDEEALVYTLEVPPAPIPHPVWEAPARRKEFGP